MSDRTLREFERRWKETSAASDRDAYVEAWQRTLPSEVCLVYRSHYEGPLSKRVVWLPGRSVLEWFQLAFTATAGRDERAIYDWVSAAVGGPIYGLPSVFRKAAEASLPVPETWAQLSALLEQRWRAEEGPHRDQPAPGPALRARDRVGRPPAVVPVRRRVGRRTPGPGQLAPPLRAGLGSARRAQRRLRWDAMGLRYRGIPIRARETLRSRATLFPLVGTTASVIQYHCGRNELRDTRGADANDVPAVLSTDRTQRTVKPA